MIDDTRGAVFQLAHALVDQRDQIDQPIGDGRVGRITDGFGIDALKANAVGVLVLRVGGFCDRDEFDQNFEFFRDTGASAENHIDELLEIEEPERQL